MMRRFAFALIVAAACSKGAPVPPLEVRNAWSRPADVGTVTAIYLTVLNHETGPVTLRLASSPLAESVSLHETMAMEGMVHMMPLDSAVIAPGDSVVLAEGGKHFMAAGLKRTLVAGDTMPIVLTFAGGRTVHVTAQVRAP